MAYSVCLYSYCGMPIPIIPAYAPEDSKTAREKCAQFIRRARRRGNYVAKRQPQPGEVARWEICTPEDAILVSDCEGILVVEQVSTGEEAATFDDEAYDV